MKLIRQPPNSSLCGQCCIAMICDVPLAQVVGYIGTDTTTEVELKRAVEFFGPTQTVTLQLIGNKHWVVKKGRKIYDPAAGVFRGLPNYLKREEITQCLDIKSQE